MKKKIIGCVVMALMMTGCASGNSETSEATESVSTEAVVAASEASSETAESESVSDEFCGVYSRIDEGEHIEGIGRQEFIYSIHEDGTGIVRCNDDFSIKWDEKNIYWEVPSGDKPYEYKFEGGVLKVKEDDGWNEYTKKPGDDPIQNGDMSAFAGIYNATDKSNSTNGGQTLGDLVFSWGGDISGSNDYPQTWPSKVTKNGDGSYLCEYDDYDFEYTVYPKGVIDEKDAGNPELKDKVYIRTIVKKDGDVKESVFYRCATFKPVSISGTWQTASIMPLEDGSMQPEHYVQFTDSEINYGHMKDGEFELDYSDKISKIEEVSEGAYKVQAETEKGLKYTYQTSESDKDILEYFSTWDEADFSNTYSGSASLSRTK